MEKCSSLCALAAWVKKFFTTASCHCCLQDPSKEACLTDTGVGAPRDSTTHIPQVAGMTTGFAGADLANLLNEAAILAVRIH